MCIRDRFIDEYLERVLSLPEPIDGLFVRNDITAIAVENALLKRGVRVPEQVAIVGFDNLEMCIRDSSLG